MWLASKTEKTQKIMDQAMDNPGRALRRGSVRQTEVDDPMAYQNFIRMPPQMFQETHY